MSRSLFEYGAKRLESIVRPGMLCVFDFDGTLAPTVKNPERACIPVPVQRRLAKLADHVRVAILTGRSYQDVSERLHFLPEFVIGSYGIEGIPGCEHRLEHYRQLCYTWAQQLTTVLSDRALFDPGIWVENKTYSLAVHYRTVGDRVKVKKQLQDLFEAVLPSTRVVAGNCVFNLLPSDAPDKAASLEKLYELSGASSVLYVGDDVMDESVFRLRREDWLMVRIERSGESAAEFYLHHRLDVIQLLDALITTLAKRHCASAADTLAMA